MEDVKIDLSGPSEAEDTIRQLVNRQRELADRNDDLKEQLDNKVAALTKAQRAIHERAAFAAAQVTPSGSDADLCRYLPGSEDEVTRHGDAFLATKEGAVQVKGVVHEDGGYTPGLLDDPEPRTEWQRELQELVTIRNHVRCMRGDRGTPQLDRQIERHMRSAPAPIRKIFADSSGIGAEWIDDTLAPQLQRELRLARPVAALFPTMQMPANSGSMLLPFLSRGLRPYKAGAAVADDPARYTASSLSTAQRTITAAKIAVRAQIDDDASEDALIAVEPLYRAELVRAHADGVEDAIMNGDTEATHQDTIASWNIRSRWGSSGLGGAGDHRKLWTGLRARAFDVSATQDGSSIETAAGARTALKLMDAPQFLGSTAFIVSPEYYLGTMLGFDEVETVDKLGPNATIVSGMLSALYGVPVVVSEFMSADLETSGLFTGGGGGKTGFIAVNRDRFYHGIKRGPAVELARDITRGVQDVVATQRRTFFTVDDSSTKNVSFSYNHTA